MPPTTALARADCRVLENLRARESGYDGGDRLLDRPEASQMPNLGTRRRTTSARRALYGRVASGLSGLLRMAVIAVRPQVFVRLPPGSCRDRLRRRVANWAQSPGSEAHAGQLLYGFCCRHVTHHLVKVPSNQGHISSSASQRT